MNEISFCAQLDYVPEVGPMMSYTNVVNNPEVPSSMYMVNLSEYFEKDCKMIVETDVTKSLDTQPKIVRSINDEKCKQELKK